MATATQVKAKARRVVNRINERGGAYGPTQPGRGKFGGNYDGDLAEGKRGARPGEATAIIRKEERNKSRRDSRAFQKRIYGEVISGGDS